MLPYLQSAELYRATVKDKEGKELWTGMFLGEEKEGIEGVENGNGLLLYFIVGDSKSALNQIKQEFGEDVEISWAKRQDKPQEPDFVL